MSRVTFFIRLRAPVKATFLPETPPSWSHPTLFPLEFGVAGWLRGHQDGGSLGAVTDDVPEKDLDERVPELFAHGTVEYKVDSVVE